MSDFKNNQDRIERLKTDFKVMDVDKKNMITQKNLKRVLNFDLSLGFTDNEIGDMIGQADHDRNGHVDEEEFIKFMRKGK